MTFADGVAAAGAPESDTDGVGGRKRKEEEKPPNFKGHRFTPELSCSAALAAVQ